MFCSSCHKVEIEKPEWLNDDQKDNEELILSHVSQFEEAKNYEEAIKLLNLFIKNGKRSQNYAHAYFRLSQFIKKWEGYWIHSIL